VVEILKDVGKEVTIEVVSPDVYDSERTANLVRLANTSGAAGFGLTVTLDGTRAVVTHVNPTGPAKVGAVEREGGNKTISEWSDSEKTVG
jgi:hypothetical protein